MRHARKLALGYVFDFRMGLRPCRPLFLSVSLFDPRTSSDNRAQMLSRIVRYGYALHKRRPSLFTSLMGQQKSLPLGEFSDLLDRSTAQTASERPLTR